MPVMCAHSQSLENVSIKVETHYGDIERASERASKSLPTLPVFSTKRSVLAC